MVAFTGSTATGKRIMEAASETLKPVFLELGGKSVNLVLDDADFEAAIPAAAGSCFHAGQGCAIPTRLLVPRSRYDEAVDLAEPAFATVAYGDPTDPSILMGPVVSKRQQDGCSATSRRARPRAPASSSAAASPPISTRASSSSRRSSPTSTTRWPSPRRRSSARCSCVIPYDDDDDAVRIANDSTYGLSGTITSGDLERAKAVARRIRTGTLGLNGGVWYGADAPFGGYKQSGIGRQCGIEGLEIFTETKTVGWPQA